MGITYRAVEWNAFKKRYDQFLALGDQRHVELDPDDN